ncbi:DUF2142 domain-containing protein [Embleya scabrispora]|uniref:DUF2142 domain-containing protein n=1 Tax=Embleya scabrispora TaxID=159449 RepID=UPI0013751A5D|nr:DUF2142 domain-containing protein [Embleya scabrispora]
MGFLFLGSAWALATPYDGTPDEMMHILRAAGVAQGEFAPKPTDADLGTGAFQSVPRSLVRENCWMFKEAQPASCAREPGGDATLERTATRAGRYNPVYYAVVGWPLRLSPDWTGILLARLVSTVMVSALLATAAHSVVRWTRHRLLLAGVLAGTTPMTLHLSGAINPNALEIASATSLFAVLVPLLLDPETKLRRSALVTAAVSGAILCTLRSVGPLWCLVALGVLLVPTRRALVHSLRRSKQAMYAAVVLVLAAGAGAAWTVIMKASQLGALNDRTHITFEQAVRFEVIARWGEYLREMVGVTSWLDASAPAAAYTAWYMVLGVLIIASIAFGTWTDRWRLFALIAVTFGFPTLTDAMGVDKYGFVAQGRYVLPVAVGVPILAAYVLSREGVFGTKRDAALIRTVALVVMPLQLVFLWFTMIRWQHGWSDKPREMTLNAFAGPWHPQVGSVAPVLIAVLGAGAVIAYCWTATRDPETAP